MLAIGGEPKTLWTSPADEAGPQLSPNGRWLAYSSNQSGQTEIYVRPFPDVEEVWQISSGGGAEPIWAGHGRELFYRNGDQMMVVAVDTEGRDFAWQAPQELFRGRFEPEWIKRANYDVTPDGEQFVMIESGESDEVPTELRVVQNWFEELRRLVRL